MLIVKNDTFIKLILSF